MVLNYKKPGFWIILVSLLLIFAAAIGFLTVPAAKNAPAENPEKPILEESVPPTTESVLETEATVPPTEEEPNPTEESDIDWAEYPDGIRIDTYEGENFIAQIMLVRDPSRVYLATSSDKLSMDTPGIRMDEALEKENAIAALNAGECYDDGTASLSVGSVPLGMSLSNGNVVWDGIPGTLKGGFVGFNRDNILIVADSMTEEKVSELEIRDGCTSEPILIVNGKRVLQDDIYGGYIPRAAIGQRSDGTVILVCTNGRSENYIGATYKDVTGILEEYDAVNACALMSGSAANMLYRDTQGRYGEKGTVQIFNRESEKFDLFLGTRLRRLPTFWMVK